MTENKKEVKPTRKPTLLEKLLLGCTIRDVPKLIPGVLLAASLVALLVWLTGLLNSALRVIRASSPKSRKL